MFELIRTYQLDIMLALCAVCMTIAALLLFTRFLSKRRKWVMINMEVTATLLLAFDRLAYVYSGDVSRIGWIMVRISNCMVFFLTSGIVFAFNLFLIDLLTADDTKIRESAPTRLKAVAVISSMGMLLAVISAFTGLYYYFDEYNKYHRGAGFLISYVIPVICPLIQYSVIRQYRDRLSKFIKIALTLYIFVPIAVGIVQIFTYGLSIVNMAMVLVSVSLYIFTYLDINDTVVRAHAIELQNLEEEQQGMRRLFDQTANAFVESVERRDSFLEGHSHRVAALAKRIAKEAGKSDEECERVYYAALLNDVGAASLTDEMIEEAGEPGERGERIRREKPIITSEILSGISEYPYLSQVARSSHERYDGSGYPDGLKSEDIPEMARIVAVADSYDSMKMKMRERDPLPDPIVREEFVKEAGITFDPVYSNIMIRIMDEKAQHSEDTETRKLDGELVCGEYRDNITAGVDISRNTVRISFTSTPAGTESGLFSAPSIILFDSFDRRVHDNEKSIESYHYLEYGEFWFNGHSVSTNIDDMKSDFLTSAALADPNRYQITAGRYEDHLRLKLESAEGTFETILALPDSTKSSYIALTGEHCRIDGIEIGVDENELSEDDIPRIAKKKNYTDRMESDIQNIQIDRTRSAATQGIEITDGLRIRFFGQSLPSANFVWHCPYVVLFSSDDGQVNGSNYREYATVKLNGEMDGTEELGTNSFTMKKSDDFPGWDKWKESCREGMEFEVRFRKKGSRVVLGSVNMGITVENTLTLGDPGTVVYAALTGDQVALTDIRIM
ncbi:MAG: HD domain-containing protein [Lachnospiraceae bacterium]|nr:HD domain-containing protein [Lachnospiraceae bacterium]